MEEKKSLGKELREKLTFTQPHIADEQPDAVAEAERFCVDYKAFLDIQSALADESADYALVISKLKVLQQRGFAPTGWQSSVAAWVSYATGRQAESVGDYDAAVTAYEMSLLR